MNTSLKKTLTLAAAGAGACLLGRTIWRRIHAFDFRDKVVLITGGSRGLGLVLARQLADEGARLAICARDPDELQRAAEDLRIRGAVVLARTCDVTHAEFARGLVEEIAQELGTVDVLINNAGIISVGPLENQTDDDFERALATHFWGPWNMISAVLPEMRERGGGRIVNVASIGGKISVPHLLPYSASKFALVGLSLGLRAELAKDGIVVTTINPGMMRTGSPRQAEFKGQHRAEYTWFSISDSLPLISMSAERAARQIINACRFGKGEVTLSLPAKAAACLGALAPDTLSALLSLTNRLLPSPGGIGQQTAKGLESTSRWSPSWITALTEAAARRNNEIAPPREPRGLDHGFGQP